MTNRKWRHKRVRENKKPSPFDLEKSNQKIHLKYKRGKWKEAFVLS